VNWIFQAIQFQQSLCILMSWFLSLFTSNSPSTSNPQVKKIIYYPILTSCYRGEIEKVKELLKDPKVDVNQRHGTGRTPLYNACEGGHIEVVKLLLNDKRVEVNSVRDTGATPFWIACSRGYIDIVKLLLNDERVDLNKADNYGRTPFYMACRDNSLEMIKILLSDERVDVNQGDSQGSTPFLVACRNTHHRTMELKFTKLKRENLDSKRVLEAVELLLNDPRIDVNQGYSRGLTPFYTACRDGKIEFVKLLLKSERIDVNKGQEGRKTPLMAAIMFENDPAFEIVQYILANGKEVDLNAKNHFGSNAMDLARDSEDKKILNLLESFEKEPKKIRKKLRIQLGMFGISSLFFFENLFIHLLNDN